MYCIIYTRLVWIFGGSNPEPIKILPYSSLSSAAAAYSIFFFRLREKSSRLCGLLSIRRRDNPAVKVLSTGSIALGLWNLARPGEIREIKTGGTRRARFLDILFPCNSTGGINRFVARISFSCLTHPRSVQSQGLLKYRYTSVYINAFVWYLQENMRVCVCVFAKFIPLRSDEAVIYGISIYWVKIKSQPNNEANY